MLLVGPWRVWEKNLTSAHLPLRPHPRPWDSHSGLEVSMSSPGRWHAVAPSASRLRARRGLLVLTVLKFTSPQGEAVPGQRRALAGVHTSLGSDRPPNHTSQGGGGRASAHLEMQGHLVQGHRTLSWLRVGQRLEQPLPEPAPAAPAAKQDAASCSRPGRGGRPRREAHRGRECGGLSSSLSLPASGQGRAVR